MSVRRRCASCGYTREYTTSTRAQASHPRHSCARERARRRAAERRAARRAERGLRDCAHPAARHRHGTRAAYVKDRCRCPACTRANTAACGSVRRQQAYGRWQPWVDPAPLRAHIRRLRAVGFGYDRIAALAETSPSHVRDLAADPGQPGSGRAIRRVRPATVQRILAVQPDRHQPSPASRIDATGTRRRVQALVALGWTPDQLAFHVGMPTGHVRTLLTAGRVTVRTAERVDRLFQQIGDQPPPAASDADRESAERMRGWAGEHGWLPPAGWDDIDTDPDVGPPAPPARHGVDLVAVERAIHGDGLHLADLTVAEQAEAVRRLTGQGRSIRQIADQLHAAPRTVSRRRKQTAA